MYTSTFNDAANCANVFNPMVCSTINPFTGACMIGNPLAANQCAQWNINPMASQGLNAFNCGPAFQASNVGVNCGMLKHGQHLSLTNSFGQCISGYVIIDACGPKLVTVQGGVYSLLNCATNTPCPIGSPVNACNTVCGVTLVPVTHFGG